MNNDRLRLITPIALLRLSFSKSTFIFSTYDKNARRDTGSIALGIA